ncbi:uncharacterized protein HaLaN_15775, partial [Haematococcus lacustris]
MSSNVPTRMATKNSSAGPGQHQHLDNAAVIGLSSNVLAAHKDIADRTEFDDEEPMLHARMSERRYRSGAPSYGSRPLSGEPLGGIQKKKAKKPKKVDDVAEGQDGQVEEASVSAVDPSAPKPVDPAAVNVMSGKKYEEEFEFEKLRRETGKARSTPWGSTYRQAPEILHGYTKKVLGVTAEERLDIRASTKADKSNEDV